MVPEIWCKTNGQTDRQTEKVTYIRVGAPKKENLFHRPNAPYTFSIKREIRLFKNGFNKGMGSFY